MTTVHVPPTFPAPLEESRFAQNGDLPSVSGFRRVAKAYNYVSTHQRKMVMCKVFGPASQPASVAGTQEQMYGVFRTGANVRSIGVMFGLAPVTTSAASSYARLLLETPAGATFASTELHHPVESSSIYAPSEIAWRWAEIELADDGTYDNTLFLAKVETTGHCRVQSVMVYEKAAPVIASADDGVTKQLVWESGHPIYDANIEDLVEAGTELWRHNGAQLISWTRDTEATAPTVTGTTAVNILDTSVTAWSASSPGFILDTEYLGSAKGDVKVELGVYGERTSASSLDSLSVYVVRNGSTIISKTGLLTGSMDPFSASTHSITARASDKVDIHIAASSGSTWRVDAIGLWLYEA